MRIYDYENLRIAGNIITNPLTNYTPSLLEEIASKPTSYLAINLSPPTPPHLSKQLGTILLYLYD